jgi:hypothetical protein
VIGPVVGPGVGETVKSLPFVEFELVFAFGSVVDKFEFDGVDSTVGLGEASGVGVLVAVGEGVVVGTTAFPPI